MSFNIKIKGRVQGVGFRPFIYRLALENSLEGYVKNSSSGVSILLNTTHKRAQEFVQEIVLKKPKMSELDSIELTPMQSNELFDGFSIKESSLSEETSLRVPVDMGMCKECEAELGDVKNRRFEYPFMSCVNCGPRFTIIKNLPYDRERTSMDAFELCDKCTLEYTNPKNRRYHAQPIGCFECGPKLSLYNKKHKPLECENILESVVKQIKEGAIVAIKGVGGYHLVCDATQDETIKLLRQRKQRDSKPFALMLKSVESVKRVAYLNLKEEELLTSHQRPIVLLKEKSLDTISPLVAPGVKQLGLFLAPNPLYQLILAKCDRPLVVTSANYSGEPLCRTYEEIMKLSNLWDYCLDNDRDIVNPCDDSICFVENDTTFMLRSARGYTPEYVQLPKSNLKKILSLGANQKSRVAMSIGSKAVMSSYLGDLGSLNSVDYYKSQVEKFLKMYNFKPEVIVCDMHPSYESTKYAFEIKKENPELELIQVQHHHAHILATMGLHGLKGEVLGVSFDGTGYADDGNLWGGEFFICNSDGYERVAHFKEFRLLGAHQAIKEPRRVALSLLFELYGKRVLELKNSVTDSFTQDELRTLYSMYKKGLNSPLTSSCGRLFDGVASLLNILHVSSYEGESGLLMETLYDESVCEYYEFTLEGACIDWSKILIGILEEKERVVAVSKFFNTLVEIILYIQKKYDLALVISGGVFQNRVLLRLLMQKVPNAFVPKEFVSNDSAIAYGQTIAVTGIK